MTFAGASGCLAARAISTNRSATSDVPRPAIHSGTNASIGSWVPSISAPRQRVWVTDSVSSPRGGFARRCFVTKKRCDALILTVPASRRAPSVRWRWSRPCPAGNAMPGACSANGRAARSAASTHAVSRAILVFEAALREASSTRAFGTLPPPLPPSNCFVYHPAPRATDFHAMRCIGSPG
jgi:hypothetical protein